MSGVIAAIIFILFVGCNIHHKHEVSVHKHEQAQNRKIKVLQGEVRQLKAKECKKIKKFHGDEIANLGGDDVK